MSFLKSLLGSKSSETDKANVPAETPVSPAFSDTKEYYDKAQDHESDSVSAGDKEEPATSSDSSLNPGVLSFEEGEST